MHQIVKIQFGSHLYGTDTPQSDVDFKGIHIPTAREILLQRVRSEIGTGPTKEAGAKNKAGDVEDKSYALHQFLKMLADGQTVCIDMLFAPEPVITSPLWSEIVRNRHRLISRKSAAFVGYCRQQANKYGIKGSRVAAAQAASEFFQQCCRDLGNTTKVGEVPQQLGDLMYGQEHMSVENNETTPGQWEQYFKCCDRMVGFKNTVKEAAQIYTRIFENYGDRARKAKDNQGIDWKALSHAVRVGYEALELLDTGNVTFPLPNRQHILDIKLGRLTYELVAEEIEKLLFAVEEAAEKSALPEQADRDWIEQLVYSEYRKAVIEA